MINYKKKDEKNVNVTVHFVDLSKLDYRICFVVVLMI